MEANLIAGVLYAFCLQESAFEMQKFPKAFAENVT